MSGFFVGEEGRGLVCENQRCSVGVFLLLQPEVAFRVWHGQFPYL